MLIACRLALGIDRFWLSTSEDYEAATGCLLEGRPGSVHVRMLVREERGHVFESEAALH